MRIDISTNLSIHLNSNSILQVTFQRKYDIFTHIQLTSLGYYIIKHWAIKSHACQITKTPIVFDKVHTEILMQCCNDYYGILKCEV